MDTRMADVNLNPMFDGVSGKFGDLVFKQRSFGVATIALFVIW